MARSPIGARVAFVEPAGSAANVFAKFMKIPLLGPALLATIAQRAGYDATVINENILGRELTDAELASYDVLGLSCLTTTVDRGRAIAARYKRVRADAGLEARTLIGGIHASMLPNDVVNDFDHVVLREAEHVILPLLDGSLDSKIVHGSRIENLDELPIPDFTLVAGLDRIRTRPLMKSRGCPYDCKFCSVTGMFGKAYRSQTPERVMAELSTYTNGTVFIADDNFAINLRDTHRLLDLMRAAGFDLPWSAQVRTDLTKHPEIVAKMRAAGCHTVYVGLESINPSALLEMGKGQTVQDIVRSLNVFHDNGMMVHGMFILGSDSDTKDTFARTSEFCLENRVDFVQYAILTPLPGSETYTALESAGRLLHKDWQFYDGLHAVFQPRHMTPHELQQGMIKCFSDFYSYTNGVFDSLRTSLRTAATTLQHFYSLYSNAYFPSFRPAMTKFVGSHIVSEWLETNKDYFNYLRTAVPGSLTKPRGV